MPKLNETVARCIYCCGTYALTDGKALPRHHPPAFGRMAPDKICPGSDTDLYIKTIAKESARK